MKVFERLKCGLYRNLKKKLQNLLPKEYEPLVTITPSIDTKRDMITVSLLIPKHLTRKLMWTFKVWKED